MSKSKKLRVEEYVPSAVILMKSFGRDREELAGRFIEFTEDYENGFSDLIETVSKLEQSMVLTEQQKEATDALYNASDAISKELSFLTFHFKRAALYSGLLTMVKKELAKRNIEGACQKMGGLISYISAEHEILESKGMEAGFPSELTMMKSELERKNSFLNELVDNKDQLYEDNIEEYKELYGFITTVSNAGKVIYEGSSKEDEYSISKIIGRLRLAKSEVEILSH